jgi:hypothetical protein
MVMTRYEFMKALNEVLDPKVYLEIGVQYGASLVQAEAAEIAFGVDPEPLIQFTSNQRPNQQIFPMTSDEFFEKRAFILPPVNLAFIDGMHLVEYALRDYINIQKYMAPGGVIVFDDVLPYSDAIAARVQPPGDWTGDVWKLYYILREGVFSQEPLLVDTFPTGTMILLDVEPNLSLTVPNDGWLEGWVEECPVPTAILERMRAFSTDEILENIRQ